VDFVNSLKSFVLQHKQQDLERKVTENNGVLKVRLDGQEVELVRGTHFYFNKKDRKGMLAK